MSVLAIVGGDGKLYAVNATLQTTNIELFLFQLDHPDVHFGVLNCTFIGAN